MREKLAIFMFRPKSILFLLKKIGIHVWSMDLYMCGVSDYKAYGVKPNADVVTETSFFCEFLVSYFF